MVASHYRLAILTDFADVTGCELITHNYECTDAGACLCGFAIIADGTSTPSVKGGSVMGVNVMKQVETGWQPVCDKWV